jgi:hypothetical protein
MNRAEGLKHVLDWYIKILKIQMKVTKNSGYWYNFLMINHHHLFLQQLLQMQPFWVQALKHGYLLLLSRLLR